MDSEDIIELLDSSDDENENHVLDSSNSDPIECVTDHASTPPVVNISCNENSGPPEHIGGNDSGQKLLKMDLDKDLNRNGPILQESVELTPSSIMLNEKNVVESVLDGENYSPDTLNDITISNHRTSGTSLSGVKRARMSGVDEHPSVRVIYSSLTRDSKKKLKELMQQWSEWHAQRDSAHKEPSEEALESGDEIYFPALHGGPEKSSAVSFWIDNQIIQEKNKEFVSLDSDSIPMYDRGYALGLTSVEGSASHDRLIETLDASRCFNCGSYSHSLKECPKPRDNVAVNNARKQHNSKRNVTSGPRCLTRYYQNSPGGKFDGLRPGILGPETRQCLGIGELDPPPWLNRMREIGYPPGYLELEAEDQPSGITIYADEESREEAHEDGEILETATPDSQDRRKMTIEFPGVNAPIPESADRRRWVWTASPGSDSFRSRSHPRSQRFAGFDANYSSEAQSPRGNNPIPRSPGLSRSLSDRGRRSPLVHDGSPGGNYGSYGEPINSPPGQAHSGHSPFLYSSPSMGRHSPHNYSSPTTSFEHWAHDSQHSSGSDLSSHRIDRHNRHHHHRK